VFRTIGNLGADESKSFKTEADILLRIRHPRVVSLFGVVESDPYCLVMELAGNSNLNSLLISKQTLDWKTRLNFALEISQGMKFLHSKNILHRDL